MRKILTTLLILLSLGASLSAEKESKTLWDKVEKKCKIAGLKTEGIFIKEDPWTMKINEDYEIFIDVMMSTLEKAKIPEEPNWFQKPEHIFLLGFIAGFGLAK